MKRLVLATLLMAGCEGDAKRAPIVGDGRASSRFQVTSVQSFIDSAEHTRTIFVLVDSTSGQEYLCVTGTDLVPIMVGKTTTYKEEE